MDATASIQAILTGVSILLIMYVGIPQYMRSLADLVRDMLVDLRIDLRCEFMKHGISLDSQQYLTMRRLIDAHVLCLEDLTLLRLRYWDRYWAVNPESRALLEKLLADATHTARGDLDEYLGTVRERAGSHLALFVMLRTPRLLAFAAIKLVWQIGICRQMPRQSGKINCLELLTTTARELNLRPRLLAEATLLRGKFAQML